MEIRKHIMLVVCMIIQNTRNKFEIHGVEECGFLHELKARRLCEKIKIDQHTELHGVNKETRTNE